MKRVLVCLLLAVCILLCACAQAEENLLPNGGFESLSASGDPEGWYPSAYRNQPGYSQMMTTTIRSHSGKSSLLIENFSENDTRYTTTVSVKPSSLYRLSCYVLVDGMEDVGNGANLAIEGIYAVSECVFDTDGEWRRIDWYGETGPKQKELTFGVRVGGYSAESVGKAYFDDVELVKVGELPNGVTADLWYDSRPSVPQAQPHSKDDGKHTTLFVTVAVLFAVGVWFANRFPLKHERKSWIVLTACFAGALLLRVVLALNTEGYPVDIGCFTAWSVRMLEKGPWGFYAPDYFCDYPPGAMLLLWPIGWLLKLVGTDGSAMQLAVKLLPIVCDLAGAGCLFALTRKRGSQAVFAACLYLLAPAAMINGAVWGQIDSLLALCILLVCAAAMQKRWRLAFPMFIVSVLVKPQALLFAPVGACYFAISLLPQTHKERSASLLDAGWGLLYALAAALAIVLPFSHGQSADWLFKLYAGTLSSYAYATLNTANLYYLAGANWTPLFAEAPRLMMTLCAIAFALAGAAFCIPALRCKVCKDHVQSRALCITFFLGWAFQVLTILLHASYAVYGYGMMAFAYAIAIVFLFFDRRPGFLPFALALALMGVYMLGVKVHERYLFPALLLLLLSYVYLRDGRLLGLFAGLCGTTFVNTAIVWENAALFGAENGHLNLDTLWLNRGMCVINLLLYGYAVYLAVTGIKEREKATAQPQNPAQQAFGSMPESYRAMLLTPSDHRMHWKRFDSAAVCIVTALYAMLAFSNLGSHAAPQTAWVSTSSEETVVLSLPESQTFRLMYYAGVSHHDFSISVSEDGQHWSKAYPCQMREGLCYRWLYVVNATVSNGEATYAAQNPDAVVSFHGRYVRINAERAGLNLWEVTARGEDDKNVPLTLVSHTGANEEALSFSTSASNLIDEADTCIGQPSWYNGTYFDEIYHARTAYEHLHGQTPYETTHPPLGKLLIACGIALFGMTPFGWRFAGALIGVAMLPALYALALQLTRRRDVAMVSMTALALDLMHFTQTRIATIDSFPLFFILLSYLFMVRYGQMDFFSGEKRMDRSFVKTLVPLFLSGFCMGLSIASKWIGMYSAVGLAVLFFTFCVRQYRAAAASFDLDEASLSPQEAARVRVAQVHTLPRILITCLFCVAFFVLVPLVVYCVSYIPYLSPNGPVTLQRIYLAQKGMLDYHSTPGLGMDHPFQSPWWQWPFLLKPMWFAQDSFETPGYASTIMCMGNPWVFYLGAAAMACVLVLWACKYLRICKGGIALRRGDGDLTLAIMCVAFLAQYLPWVLVPRSMYIYHYFASVPFIILATAWCLSRVPDDKRKLKLCIMTAYLMGALVFFVMYFPYASGRLTSIAWLNAVKGFFRLYY